MRDCKKKIWTHWKIIVVIAAPLILLPLPCFYNTQEGRCAYALLIMAAYWLTEALPIAITSLLPMVLLPLLGLVPARDVSANYFKDTNMLVLGGLVIAVSIEHSKLHKRIALKMLLMMGTGPKWLMLSFMLSTWFLSMWISSTATTAMMIAVATAILEPLREAMVGRDTSMERLTQSSVISSSETGDSSSDTITTDELSLQVRKGRLPEIESIEIDIVTDTSDKTEAASIANHDVNEQQYLRFCRFFPLCISYASNIGGMATLTGTPPNMVLKEQAELVYQKHGAESPITFARWAMFALPLSALCIAVAWLWLVTLYTGFRCPRYAKTSNKTSAVVKRIFQKEYETLGCMSLAEVFNVILTGVLILLWLTRNPGFVVGWGSLFADGFVSDSVPAIMLVILLFILPAKKPTCGRRTESLLNIQTLVRNTQWGVLLLVGGGFALADACGKSGLSEMIGGALVDVKSLPEWLVVLLVASLVAALTELTTNTATVNLILPIVAELANKSDLNPLHLMLPTTIAASFSFMLPVATPGNAIVMSCGRLRIIDMARAGLLLNVVCVLIVTLAVETWGACIFDLNAIPWQTNSTAVFVTNLTTLD